MSGGCGLNDDNDNDDDDKKLQDANLTCEHIIYF